MLADTAVPCMGPHPGLRHQQLSPTGNFATWPSVQLDTRKQWMHTSKKLLYNMSSRGIAEERNEGTSTSPHLYFGRGQSSKWLQGKTTSVARLFGACTAMRSFWCQAHTLTDDGKSRCGEKLSGFYRTSERHFKGKGNVQVIKKPILLMCFKTAIIHLMPKRRKKKKESKNNKKDATAYNFYSFLYKFFRSPPATDRLQPSKAVCGFLQLKILEEGPKHPKFAHLNNTRDKNKL